MASRLAPNLPSKKTNQKTQISQGEYDIRAEWAPETIKDYEVAPKTPAPEPQPKKQPKQRQPNPAPETEPEAPVDIQGRVPNRRVQARSSSLFEEWKSKALRPPSSEKPQEKKSGQTRRRKGNSANEGSASSADAGITEPPKEHLEKPASIRAKSKPATAGRGPQTEAMRNVGSTASGHIKAIGSSKEPSDEAGCPGVETKSEGRAHGRQLEASKTVRGTTSGEPKAPVPSDEAASLRAINKPAFQVSGQHPEPKKIQESAVSGDVRVSLGERFDQDTNTQFHTKPVSCVSGRQQSKSKAQAGVTPGDARPAFGEQDGKAGNALTEPKAASDTGVHQPDTGKDGKPGKG